MENRIYYGEYTLKHWIDMMLRREIELPKYQRYFSWKEEKVETLIDTFSKDEFVPPVTIGAYNDKEKGLQNLIIDGQQRLTSILLAYLGKYPDREKYAEMQESFAYDENEVHDEELENSVTSYSESKDDLPLNWQYSVLTRLGRTKDEILTKINEGDYNKLEIRKQEKGQGKEQDQTEIITVDDKFLENHYMGFCYIVPKTSDSQTEFYSSVFRHINIQGERLSHLESRRALYYLKDGLEKFFEPDFCQRFSMTDSKKMDFVRYLSFLSQYNNNKEKPIAYRYMRKLEQYYEDYIDSIVKESDSNLFGNYSKGAAIDFESQMKVLEDYINKIDFGDASKSIIDMDVYFMGLIYMVLFEKKKLNEGYFEDLSEEIREAIKEFKSDNEHKFRPNTMGRINVRLRKSIEIYNRYVVEG